MAQSSQNVEPPRNPGRFSLLEKHKLGEALFAKVGAVLQANGMKVGTCTIADASIIGAPSSTNKADKVPLPDLLRGQEPRVYGDCAYASQGKLIHKRAPAAVDMTDKTVRAGSPTEELVRMVNCGKSRVRSRVEHVFAVVKKLWGFSKVR